MKIGAHRHPAVRDVAQWFEYEHLPAGLMRETSSDLYEVAELMVETLDDCAELTVGLRKLLEAKDCFVRAAKLTLDTPEINDRYGR